jgi:putative hydrolase of HD superfamily
MASDRIQQQIAFIMELDKLKTIYRRAYLAADASRREDDAEHSWHVAIMANILQEYSPAFIDINRVIRILLIHDIVEIDAGDVSIYHRTNPQEIAEKEHQAAVRIFGLLPVDQRAKMMDLWNEFEASQTPESRFAKAMDRLIPLLHNYYTQGKRWKEDGITYEQVMEINRKIEETSPELWTYAKSLIEDSLAKGFLKKSILSEI